MYNETYEDYIRSILGYPNYGNYGSCGNCLEDNYQTMSSSNRMNEPNRQLEACYPEIYKLVYPMVNKACNTNNRPITPELIDELTNEIYLSIENDTQINVNINLTNEVGGSTSNRSNVNTTTTNNNTNHTTTNRSEKENRGEDRQFRNRGLQDLIRILLIRELLGRPGNRPPMPPHRPPIMRPPFPGGPGHGGPRPPIMPRDRNDFSNLYEM